MESHHLLQAGNIQYTYDLNDRLTSVSTDQMSETEIRYDPVGNLTSHTLFDAVFTTPCSYGYDDLYQICRETGFSHHYYKNDSLYNQCRVDDLGRTVNALNQLLQEGGISYCYDANGNRIKTIEEGQTTAYAYDALDRLITVDNGRNRTVMQYDALNRRICQTVGSFPATYYLYQNLVEIGATNSAGNMFEYRLTNNSGYPFAIELGGKAYAAVQDHAKNVLALIDADTGWMAGSHWYSAFREEDGLGVLSPWRYAGQRYDKETKLNYFIGRYYDPQTSCWLTPDPIGRTGGANLYAYTLNNPLTIGDILEFFPTALPMMNMSYEIMQPMPMNTPSQMKDYQLPLFGLLGSFHQIQDFPTPLMEKKFSEWVPMIY